MINRPCILSSKFVLVGDQFIFLYWDWNYISNLVLLGDHAGINTNNRNLIKLLLLHKTFLTDPHRSEADISVNCDGVNMSYLLKSTDYILYYTLKWMKVETMIWYAASDLKKLNKVCTVLSRLIE